MAIMTARPTIEVLSTHGCLFQKRGNVPVYIGYADSSSIGLDEMYEIKSSDPITIPAPLTGSIYIGTAREEVQVVYTEL